MQLFKLTPSLFDHLYQDIIEFRNTFGLPVNAPETLTEKADLLHTSLAIEELTELADADNQIEQADAIVDSVYVLVGRLAHLGQDRIEDNLAINYLIDLLLHIAENKKINFIACWDEIHSSNMSKVCRNLDEFNQTAAHYAKDGIKLTPLAMGDYVVAKCAEDFVSEQKIIRQGKVLKSIYYRPANLAPVVALDNALA